jgi:hypothetical protein
MNTATVTLTFPQLVYIRSAVKNDLVNIKKFHDASAPEHQPVTQMAIDRLNESLNILEAELLELGWKRS